jgi:hypothetical protein
MISSESASNLDILSVKVRNPFTFRSENSLELMPRGTEIQTRIPPQVPGGSQDQLEESVDDVKSAT